MRDVRDIWFKHTHVYMYEHHSTSWSAQPRSALPSHHNGPTSLYTERVTPGPTKGKSVLRMYMKDNHDVHGLC